MDIPAEPRLNHRVRVEGGLLEEESQTLLQEFFRSRRDPAKSDRIHVRTRST